MAIEFRCTQCARLLRVPDNAAGKPAQCPGCGALMTIPGVPAGDPDNPYQSPMHYGEAPPPSGMRRAGTPAGRVIAPAIGLIAVAVLEIELLLCMVVGALVGFAERGARDPRGMAPDVPAFVGSALVLAVAGLGIVLSVVVIVGAVKMKNLENRGFAMAAAVVVMLPFFMPGFLLGLPLGIWALVVLCDPQVKPLFGTGTPYVY